MSCMMINRLFQRPAFDLDRIFLGLCALAYLARRSLFFILPELQASKDKESFKSSQLLIDHTSMTSSPCIHPFIDESLFADTGGGEYGYPLEAGKQYPAYYVYVSIHVQLTEIQLFQVDGARNQKMPPAAYHVQ